jgi:hypothetical protein
MWLYGGADEKQLHNVYECAAVGLLGQVNHDLDRRARLRGMLPRDQ